MADTGIGMTPEQQARLFEEFTQSTGRPGSASAGPASASQEGDQLGEDTVTIIRCFRWRMLPLPKVVRGVVVWQAL